MYLVTSLVGFVLPVIGLLYYLVHKRYRYWTRRNVLQVEPRFPVGNLEGFGTTKHLFHVLDSIYCQFKASTRFVGAYFGVMPVLVVLDLELVKDVLIKDFDCFTSRGMYVNERDDPLSAHLFAIEGERWRYLRGKLSPAFTAGKIKLMFDGVLDTGEMLLSSIEGYVNRHEPVDVQKVSQFFTCDAIGLCAFGLRCNALRNEGCRMIEIGDLVLKPNGFRLAYIFMLVAFRKLSESLHLKLLPAEVTEYFMGLLCIEVDARQQHKTTSSDFLQLLINLKNKGNVDKQEGDSSTPLTFNELAAQAFMFFLAGFETSSSALTFSLYSLASNGHIQDKVREEILHHLQESDGKATYDNLKDMTYLDQVINESLRMYPPASQLSRIASASYHLSSTDVTLEKGTMVVIPTYSFHYDAELYPDPYRFDPDRFTPECIQRRHPCAFLPFGEGPRSCIGMRFGLLLVKFGIVQLLSRYRIAVNQRTKTPLSISTNANFFTAEGGMWLDVTPL